MKKPKKVLLLGSGALKIGEAGEFDYSGSQAIKALKEEGLEVVLINPNIATIQTSEGMADRVYFLPVTPYFVREGHRPGEAPRASCSPSAARRPSTAASPCGRAASSAEAGLPVLGTPMEAVEKTEDRKLFNRALAEAGLKTPRGIAVRTVEAGLRAAGTIGYPVMARVAYALGGKGSGIAYSPRELREALRKAFTAAPQVLIEEYLDGWKEIEYEVVRDRADNCVTVCNMENFDPMGIHTGESIVIAPSQTLTNEEYHRLAGHRPQGHPPPRHRRRVQHPVRPQSPRRRLPHHRGQRPAVAQLRPGQQGHRLPAGLRRRQARPRPHPARTCRTRSPRSPRPASSRPSTTSSSRSRAGTSRSSAASRRRSARR